MESLSALLQSLTDPGQFMPHGYCLYWRPELLYMHVVSDLAIALAYFSIPITIVVLLHKHNQLLPYRWVFACFAVFIFLCGASHLVELVTLWYPIYYIEGAVKVATAAASLATAFLMFPLLREIIDKIHRRSRTDAAGGGDRASWPAT